jgi:hypothetical protein
VSKPQSKPRTVKKAVSVHLESVLEAEAKQDEHIIGFEIYSIYDNQTPAKLFTVSTRNRAVIRHTTPAHLPDMNQLLAQVAAFVGKPPEAICASDVQRWKEAMAARAASAPGEASEPGASGVGPVQ